jgi:hypothetical protein
VASFYQHFQSHHHLFVAIVTFSSLLHEPYDNLFCLLASSYDNGMVELGITM